MPCAPKWRTQVFGCERAAPCCHAARRERGTTGWEGWAAGRVVRCGVRCAGFVERLSELCCGRGGGKCRRGQERERERVGAPRAGAGVRVGALAAANTAIPDTRVRRRSRLSLASMRRREIIGRSTEGQQTRSQGNHVKLITRQVRALLPKHTRVETPSAKRVAAVVARRSATVVARRSSSSARALLVFRAPSDKGATPLCCCGLVLAA